MKFILLTQNAPKEETQIGELKISPNKRVKIITESMTMYWDSMNVEVSVTDWSVVNEWVTFHNIIFNDSISLEWYESENFNSDKLISDGECVDLVDYSDISKKVYFLEVYPSVIRYEDLYNKYIGQSKENKALVKNYFNSFGDKRVVFTERKIRDDNFLRILVLFSIIESIIGDSPYCPKKISCCVHGKIYPHKTMSSKDWIKSRLSEIIKNKEKADAYSVVVLEVREKIRHKTVHKGAISEAQHIPQAEGEITWDWVKTTEEWSTNSTALENLQIQMNDIARSLLLNRIFDLTMFPALRPLHSVRISSKVG